jgi:6-phosphofructokinase 1/ribokinase
MEENFLAFFGHLNIDVVMRVPSLPCRGSVNIQRHEENYGGTAGNFAVVASSLGVPFHLYSAVSQNSHGKFLEFLDSRDIDTEHIHISGDYGPICYSATDGKDQVYYIYQGPMDEPFSKAVLKEDSEYRWIHLGTGPQDDYINVAENIKGKKVFDPGQEISYRYSRDDIIRMASASSLWILNEHELSVASKILGVPEGQVIDMTPETIVTRGASGSTLYGPNGRTEIKSRKSKVVFDTIGAGDAYRAGFYLGIYRGLDTAHSCAVGSIVSGLAVQKPLREFNYTASDIFDIFHSEAEDLIIPQKD